MVKEISSDDFAGLVARYDDKAMVKEDYGSFVVHDGDVWIGVDNRSGDCWTEEFATEEDARKYAEG